MERHVALLWRQAYSHKLSFKQPICLYAFFFFEIPKEVLKKLNFYRSRFFWQGDGHKRKYRLSKWDILCRPKEQGGLGIMDLKVRNKFFLSKWLFKLTNEDGIWQQILRNKYLKSKTLTQVEKKLVILSFGQDLCQ